MRKLSEALTSIVSALAGSGHNGSETNERKRRRTSVSRDDVDEQSVSVGSDDGSFVSEDARAIEERARHSKKARVDERAADKLNEPSTTATSRPSSMPLPHRRIDSQPRTTKHVSLGTEHTSKGWEEEKKRLVEEAARKEERIAQLEAQLDVMRRQLTSAPPPAPPSAPPAPSAPRAAPIAPPPPPPNYRPISSLKDARSLLRSTPQKKGPPARTSFAPSTAANHTQFLSELKTHRLKKVDSASIQPSRSAPDLQAVLKHAFVRKPVAEQDKTTSLAKQASIATTEKEEQLQVGTALTADCAVQLAQPASTVSHSAPRAIKPLPKARRVPRSESLQALAAASGDSIEQGSPPPVPRKDVLLSRTPPDLRIMRPKTPKRGSAKRTTSTARKETSQPMGQVSSPLAHHRESARDVDEISFL